MDLELTDEQQWLSEAVETLLGRVWPGSGATRTPARDPEALWQALVAFGALSVDRDEGLGAVELCLVSRALGAAPRVRAVRRQRRPAVRRRAAGRSAARGTTRSSSPATTAVSVALLEPGRGWSVTGVQTTLGPSGLRGRKVAVEHAESVDRLAVVASLGGTARARPPARQTPPASPSPRSRRSTRWCR